MSWSLNRLSKKDSPGDVLLYKRAPPKRWQSENTQGCVFFRRPACINAKVRSTVKRSPALEYRASTRALDPAGSFILEHMSGETTCARQLCRLRLRGIFLKKLVHVRVVARRKTREDRTLRPRVRRVQSSNSNTLRLYESERGRIGVEFPDRSRCALSGHRGEPVIMIAQESAVLLVSLGSTMRILSFHVSASMSLIFGWSEN